MGKKGTKTKKRTKSAETKGKKEANATEEVPETERAAWEESDKLQAQAFDEGILSSSRPEIPPQVLRVPRSLTENCNGAAITNKGRSRNRKAMLLFPGKLDPACFGERLGNLVKLNTPNPELHIDFPKRGRLVMKGTLCQPKNKYLSLSYPIGDGGGDMRCNGSVDMFVVFATYEWLGTEAENPSRKPLPLPAFLAKPSMKQSTSDRVSKEELDEGKMEDESSNGKARAKRGRTTVKYKDVMPAESDEELVVEQIDVSSSSEDELIFKARKTVAYDDFEG